MLKYRWGYIYAIHKNYMNQCSALVPRSPTSTFGSRILIHNCTKYVRTHPVVQHGPHPEYNSPVHPAMIPSPGQSPFPEVIPRRSLCRGHHRQGTTSEGGGGNHCPWVSPTLGEAFMLTSRCRDHGPLPFASFPCLSCPQRIQSHSLEAPTKSNSNHQYCHECTDAS